MYITKLTPDLIGKEVKYKYHDDIIQGKLQFEKDKWYFCQNEIHGADCNDKLGYKYSFYFSDPKNYDIQLIENESNYEIY